MKDSGHLCRIDQMSRPQGMHYHLFGDDPSRLWPSVHISALPERYGLAVNRTERLLS